MSVPGALAGGTAWFLYETTTAALPQWSWRRELATVLEEVPAPTWSVDDVVLVAGELVANAVEHGGGAHRLRVTGTPRGVLVEVRDPAEQGPRPQPVSLESERGRGLSIVGALSDEWGWRPEPPDGKAVWARIGQVEDERGDAA
ncbi:MAG: ATP-binding protein [Actinobacteria bacterium]|jgi:anti-sigma regulatory factor (Ser/Thr protein kinase)|nr:ATP-binding protein [Actinomycetota bacterium]